MKFRSAVLSCAVLLSVCAAIFVPAALAQSNRGCVQAKAVSGGWQISSCLNSIQNVAFTQPNVTTPNGGNAANLNATFVLFPGQTYNEGDSRYAYKVYSCVSPAVPTDARTGTVPNYYSVVECGGGTAGSAQ